VEQAFRRYLVHLEQVQGRAPNTILAYDADLRQLRQAVKMALGHDPSPLDLDAAAARSYVAWLSAQGYRPATTARKAAAARSFVEYLQTVEGMALPGVVPVLKAPTPRRRAPKVLTSEEVQRMVDLAGRGGSPRGLRDAGILAILYATGMRAVDAVNLKVADVDIEAATVRVAGSHLSPVPLGASLPVVERYLTAGRRHLAVAADDKALFLNQRGRAMSRQGLWLVVKRWATAAGIGSEVSPHSLRHSLAYRLLDQGKSKREVRMMLGLSSPNAMRLSREGDS
jgi:integrase/recombinase XerD